ncbi:MAG: DUF2851 family protein [Bacteroidetes bacterium]|nr:DUF2851 family protein [Bacteroidota bacterium]MBL6963378.1 DUF2851 family protein [Bacteroidota bacterium]
MKEELLHFIWKYQLFKSTDLKTNEGESIQIIHQGLLNQDAGPDFSQAKVKIGETVWAGNIELHVNSSDWFKHKHHADPAYQNVILHVVYEIDSDRIHDLHCPTLSLSEFMNMNLINYHQYLMQNRQWIPCLSQLHQVDPLSKLTWQNRLLVIRFERKYAQIQLSLAANESDWQQSFYEHLAKSFGYKVNADAFENLATRTPFKLFSWHKNNLLQIEALLFGQSGLLPTIAKDSYTQTLVKEYEFLKSKYGLTPLSKTTWKFARMRPSNFPTIRISQLAYLLSKSSSLFSKITEITQLSELYHLFQTEASYYWAEHYQFDQVSNQKRRKKLGVSSIHILLINSVIPFLFAFGKEKQLEHLVERSIDFIETLKAENNAITNRMHEIGFENKNAAHSQALIELYTHYCKNKKCLECNMGTSLLRKQTLN